MPHPSWNESYASGQPPWDTRQPEPLLAEFVTSGGVAPVRTLEICAGNETNSIWLGGKRIRWTRSRCFADRRRNSPRQNGRKRTALPLRYLGLYRHPSARRTARDFALTIELVLPFGGPLLLCRQAEENWAKRRDITGKLGIHLALS